MTSQPNIVERLRATEPQHRIAALPSAFWPKPALINPDGPEAADTINELAAALDNARWLLEGIKRAGWVTNPSFGDEINLGLDRVLAALSKVRTS